MLFAIVLALVTTAAIWLLDALWKAFLGTVLALFEVRRLRINEERRRALRPSSAP